MGAASLLASLVARQYSSLRQHSKLAAAEMDHDRADDGPDAAGALQPLRGFHVDLAERLQQLQLHGAGNAHLNWLLDALASTLSTHSSLQLALTHGVPAATTTATSPLKHRADEVLSMLDVCTALQQVADDVDRQFGRLQQAVQSVGQALMNSSDRAPFSSGGLRAAAHRLSACLLQDTGNIALCINSKQYKPLAEARSSLLLAAKGELQSPAATLLGQALDGALLTSLLVLASAVSSLAPPSPKKRSATITRACKMIIKYLSAAKGVSAPAWAAPLCQLHRDLRQEDLSATGGALFQELQCLHAAASKLHATIALATGPARAHSSIELAAVKQSAQSLRKSLQEAHACVTMFRTQMACFFQALVALRLTLLNC